MNRDPRAWENLGRAVRIDRERQGLTRDELARRIKERGGSVTTRTIANIESGIAPRRRAYPPSLEPIVAALGWPPGKADRILAGEDIAGAAAPQRPREQIFTDPMAQKIWELDLPVEERVKAIRDLMDAEQRRRQEELQRAWEEEERRDAG